MPKIAFSGMASGLPPNIVDQLVEAERIPLKNIEVKKGKQESRLKLVEDLETKLTGVQGSIGTLASVKGFSDIQLISGDPNIISGIVDPGNAVNGTWTVEVLELAEKAAALTNGFADKNETRVGVGYLKFNTPEGTKDVYIDSDHSTLDGVAKAINSARIGMKASIINDKKDPALPYRLIISADSTGDENQIEFPTLYFVDGDQDFYFDETRPAKNGRVKVDGIEFEVADNSVKDAIPGATLELRQQAAGRPVSITVKENQEAVTGKVKEFVDAMNAVLGFIQQQNKLDERTDTSSTLGGDNLLRTVESRMRNLVQTPQYGVGEFKHLNQIGITFGRNGLLSYDEKKFQSVLAANPNAVQKFLAGDGFQSGFIPTLRREVGNLLNTSFGAVANRKRGLQDRLKEYDRNIERKEKELVKKEDMLRNKFARLEESVSRIKSQGGALSGMPAPSAGQGPSLG